MNARTQGLVSLWAGVLLGSFVSVRHTDHIEWWAYAIAAALAGVGVVRLRSSAKAEANEGDRVGRDIGVLHESLATLVDRLDALVGAEAEVEVYDVKDKIDGELAEMLATFADRRESMIAAHGLDRYADVMTAFAGGERLINRAWSASADGYIDEVWPCLQRAAALMHQARDRLVAPAEA